MTEENEKIEGVNELLIQAKSSRDHYKNLVVQLERELEELLR